MPAATVIIPLSKGYSATIDADDFALVSRYKWYASPRRIRIYAQSTVGKHRLYMHRLITNAPDGVEVDHKNRDGLDNRKANLRLCNGSLNRMNSGKAQRRNSTSTFRGVSYDKERECWQSRVYFERRCIARKRFATEQEAARFYDETVAALLNA